MHSLVIAASLLAQPPAAGSAEGAPADRHDPVRAEYLADAQRCLFHHDAQKQHELELIEKPVMRWATDDDWSGDVFVWTRESLPEVVGCILSGPGNAGRPVYHEFHVLGEQPIAPITLQTRRLWQPSEGLKRLPVPEAPTPAETAAGRLVQMRQMARDFTAHMEADGTWELRLLPQPVFRYRSESAGVTDGALFTYVWSKGTDPELVLLLECRMADKGPNWHFAPLRLSTRELWLQHHESEVWHVAAHQEPQTETTMIYTTAYARTMATPPTAGSEQEN
ncbi:MAG TPA: hypothetical protein VFV87_10085 [Pirellulaceae bacterium]|nr:hypothetical protein [Pirellulaceae bacterium]